MIFYKFALILLFIPFVIAASTIEDLRYQDPRYCGMENIQRKPNGDIKRSTKVLDDFQKIWACPNTGSTTGACEWLKDHVIPLANGGCDAVHNLQYLPPVIKSGAGKIPKDRWERKINTFPVTITPVPK